MTPHPGVEIKLLSPSTLVLPCLYNMCMGLHAALVGHAKLGHDALTNIRFYAVTVHDKPTEN